MQNEYADNFGFIIFKLDIDRKEYHPFAYSHAISGEMYIPTKHYHPHSTENDFVALIDNNMSMDEGFGINMGGMGGSMGLDNRAFESIQFDNNNIDSSPMFAGLTPVYGQNSYMPVIDIFWKRGPPQPKKKQIKPIRKTGFSTSTPNSTMADDWGHEIYFYNTGNSVDNSGDINMMKSKRPNDTYMWDNTLKLKKQKIDFDLEECDNFEKVIIKGTHANKDLIIGVC